MEHGYVFDPTRIDLADFSDNLQMIAYCKGDGILLPCMINWWVNSWLINYGLHVDLVTQVIYICESKETTISHNTIMLLI